MPAERPEDAATPPAPAHARGAPPWHAREVAAVLAALGAGTTGLTGAEAASRRARHGPNRLPAPPRRGPWRRLAAQFHNVLIYVLLGAGAVTAGLGHGVDAAVIFGVVVLNALIGFVQEGKAERALEAVRGMLSPQAIASRDGRRVTLPAEDLVPGDLVHLQSGDRVPADLRLVRARDLRVDESVLTGESVPVEKSTAAVDVRAPLGERAGMAFSGTLVTFGQGGGVVVGTGSATEIGRISDLLARVRPLTTPLLRQLGAFGRWLTAGILAVAAASFAFGTLLRGFSAAEMFLAAVGLAVAAIPEGLPAIITITLAVGVQRMARRNAIIRRLPAVETLGSVTIICSDKTGTLTRNEMTALRVVLADGALDVSGAGYEPHGAFLAGAAEVPVSARPALESLVAAAMLCNDAGVRNVDGEWRVDGDPTEGALVVLGMKAGLEPVLVGERFPRTDVIPFESEHRFMATLHHDHAGNGFVYVKGAPEVLLPRCGSQRVGDRVEAIDEATWRERVEAIAADGQRPLAIAMRPAPAEQRVLAFADVEQGLTLLGLVGLIDPPREEAVAAVARCRDAGIRVKMITGDHGGTARAIAQRMGIGEGRVLYSGDRLSALDAEALRRAAVEADVFARTSPEHKLKLVTALQADGEVVAMTGDGVNDAPALKRADVGVAMGVKGTEAAKESAEMVLADDNFASIVHAVEEGRTVYDNIKKSILFILPTNGGEALTILAAIALGRVLPITAAQILWVNMVTAVTLALALAFEPPERDIMRRPPRDPHEPILSLFMLWRIAFVSVIMVAVTFGLFVWERQHGADVDYARTVAVNALVVLEIWYLFTTRYLHRSAIQVDGLVGNLWALVAVAAVLALQMAFTYAAPMQALFRSAPIAPEAWARIVVLGSLVLVLVEIEKRVRNGRSVGDSKGGADQGAAADAE